MWPTILSIIKYLCAAALYGCFLFGYASYKELKKTEEKLKNAEETIKHLEKKLQCAEKVIEMFSPNFFKGGDAIEDAPQTSRKNTKGE